MYPNFQPPAAPVQPAIKAEKQRQTYIHTMAENFILYVDARITNHDLNSRIHINIE